jgi:RNA polymerase sigma-70 factor (ECF subfamily)
VSRIKRKVSARQFQIFDCAVHKGWPVTKVAQTLDVSIAQVYLAKSRVAGLIKREIEALERFS